MKIKLYNLILAISTLIIFLSIALIAAYYMEGNSHIVKTVLFFIIIISLGLSVFSPIFILDSNFDIQFKSKPTYKLEIKEALYYILIKESLFSKFKEFEVYSNDEKALKRYNDLIK